MGNCWALWALAPSSWTVRVTRVRVVSLIERTFPRHRIWLAAVRAWEDFHVLRYRVWFSYRPCAHVLSVVSQRQNLARRLELLAQVAQRWPMAVFLVLANMRIKNFRDFHGGPSRWAIAHMFLAHFEQ